MANAHIALNADASEEENAAVQITTKREERQVFTFFKHSKLIHKDVKKRIKVEIVHIQDNLGGQSWTSLLRQLTYRTET